MEVIFFTFTTYYFLLLYSNPTSSKKTLIGKTFLFCNIYKVWIPTCWCLENTSPPTFGFCRITTVGLMPLNHWLLTNASLSIHRHLHLLLPLRQPLSSTLHPQRVVSPQALPHCRLETGPSQFLPAPPCLPLARTALMHTAPLGQAKETLRHLQRLPQLLHSVLHPLL